MTFGATQLVGFGANVMAPVPELLWTPFREGTGTTAASIVGPSITLNGTGSWAAGPNGYGYGWGNLSSGGYGTTSADITYGVSIITICTWCYMDRFFPYPGEVYDSNGSTNNFILDTGNRFAYLNGTSGASTDDYPYASWTTNAWEHWAVIWDNSTTAGEIDMYYNGALQTPTTEDRSKDASGTLTGGTFSVLGNSSGSGLCRGRISDVRIYNRALSAAEILAVYRAPRYW